MELLDKLTVALLYGASDLGKVLAPDLHGQEAIDQRECTIKVRAEHGSHEKPRLRGLRGLCDAADFGIGRWLARFIKRLVGAFSRGLTNSVYRRLILAELR